MHALSWRSHVLPEGLAAMRAAVLLGPALALVGCGATVQTYDLGAARRIAIGLRWREHTHVAHEAHMRLRFDGRPEQDHATTQVIDFEADFVALDVGSDGWPTRSRVTVHRFVVDEGEGPISPTLPGDLLVSAGASGTIESPAGPLDDATLGWLAAVIETGSIRESENVFLLERAPRAIGDEWPVDVEAAARDLADDHLRVEPSGVTGSTRLVGLERVGDADCLVILSRVEATLVATLPGTTSEGPGDTWEETRSIVPLDGSLPTLRRSFEMVLHFEIPVVREAGPGVVAYESRTAWSRERVLE